MSNQTASRVRSQLNANTGAPSLLDRSMTWMAELYDDRVGLLAAPGSGGQRHLIRESIWYALGIAVSRCCDRDHPHHQQLADIVEAVLAAQWNAPGTPWHGTFRRSPEEPDPPEDAKIWRDYDPNWRQFIGSVLILLLRLESDDLLAGQTEKINRALKRCIQGEPEERVPASYTNIALMKAWLDVETAHLTEPAVRQRGLNFARQIAQGFEQHNSFAEYNSPTYYGINLYALGLWQHYSNEPELQQHSQQISASLWRDIAEFYHPRMKNLCGPFSRAYGMDMQQYVAAVGLWIWSVAGESCAPFPMTALASGTMDHAHDFALGPLAAITASSPSAQTVKRFRGFNGQTDSTGKLLERLITDQPVRQASIWMTANLMAGLETAEVSFRGNPQYHPFTLHWLDDQRLRWLNLRFAGRLQGILQAGSATLSLIPDKGTDSCLLQSSDLIVFEQNSWRCGNLSLVLDTSSVCTPVANGIQISELEGPATLIINFKLNGAAD